MDAASQPEGGGPDHVSEMDGQCPSAAHTPHPGRPWAGVLPEPQGSVFPTRPLHPTSPAPAAWGPLLQGQLEAASAQRGSLEVRGGDPLSSL